MSDRSALTSEITGLERAFESVLTSTVGAIEDGEWDIAAELYGTLRVLDRQLQYRLDDLAELDAEEGGDAEVVLELDEEEGDYK